MSFLLDRFTLRSPSMIYLDSRRKEAIKRFLAMVKQTRIEPYFSLLNALRWSCNGKITAYHQYYYCQYFVPTKAERRMAFEQKLQALGKVSLAQMAIYVIRTALMEVAMEGVTQKPSSSLPLGVPYLLSSLLTTAGLEHIEMMVSPYYQALMTFYLLDDSEVPAAILSYQKNTISQLAKIRDEIAMNGFPDWKERYQSWHYILLFDQGEAEHLAALPYPEFLESDYWHSLRHHIKRFYQYRCSDCGAKGPLEVHHDVYDFRGQELLFSNSLACLCSTCHRKAHGLID